MRQIYFEWGSMYKNRKKIFYFTSFPEHSINETKAFTVWSNITDLADTKCSFHLSLTDHPNSYLNLIDNSYDPRFNDSPPPTLQEIARFLGENEKRLRCAHSERRDIIFHFGYEDGTELDPFFEDRLKKVCVIL